MRFRSPYIKYSGRYIGLLHANTSLARPRAGVHKDWFTTFPRSLKYERARVFSASVDKLTFLASPIASQKRSSRLWHLRLCANEDGLTSLAETDSHFLARPRIWRKNLHVAHGEATKCLARVTFDLKTKFAWLLTSLFTLNICRTKTLHFKGTG